MSRARSVSQLLGGDGTFNATDVSGLAVVATSGSASDLSAGTLPIARIANSSVTATKLAAQVKILKTGGRSYGTISNGGNYSLTTVQFNSSNPFPSDSGLLFIDARALVKLSTRGNSASDAIYYKVYKNSTPTSGQFTTSPTGTNICANVNDSNMGYRVGSGNWFSDGWALLSFGIQTTHTAGDSYQFYAYTDSANCSWDTNELNIDFTLITNITVA